jgi:hypothetical protein
MPSQPSAAALATHPEGPSSWRDDGRAGCRVKLEPGPDRTRRGAAVQTRPGYLEGNHGSLQRNRLCPQDRVVTVRMARE